MNDATNHNDNMPEENRPEENRPDDQAGDRDLLMARIIDGEARPEDWRAFREMAARDASVWTELGEMQHQDEELARAVRTLTDRAGDVDLPTHVAAHDVHREQFERRLGVAARWSGWLVAACVVLAWGTGMRLGDPLGDPIEGAGGAGPQPVEAGVLLANMSPEDRFDAYVEAGRQRGDVLGAVPEPVVLETRATESGGIEVLVLRQVVERRVVEDIYRATTDETGREVTLPARITPAPRAERTAF